MKLRQIKDFIHAYRNVDYYFRPLDEALLDACRKNPYHNNKEEVFAKIALVNRTYGANLRWAGKEAEWRLAKKVVQEKLDKQTLAAQRYSSFQ